MQRMLRAERGGRAGRMMIRRLKTEEHYRTRKLWEEVFTEDTKEFLDYYYFIKARTNEIYVAEEDGDIRSMLQLNPYTMQVCGRTFPSNYIIAVATQKEYRGRGCMGSLLKKSMEDMYARRVPFTFLMPAAEAIYTPYDFRYIYRQKTGILPEHDGADKAAPDPGTESSDAGIWEAELLSDFFEQNFAGKWQVYTVRDEEYYRTLILEQQSERGGVRILRDKGRIVGMFAYASEDETEIREPLILPGYEKAFERSVCELQRAAGRPVRIYGYDGGENWEERPLIMARILYLPALLGALKVPEGVSADCSFAVIDPLIRQNSRVWRVRSGSGEERLHVSETEDSEGVIPVAELTEFLFGMKTAEEISRSEHVILSDRLVREMEKIEKLSSVFINEIV